MNDQISSRRPDGQEDHRLLALSSMILCAKSIDRIARTGEVDYATLAALQAPLFVLNPRSAGDVFAEPASLSPGLASLHALGSEGSLRDAQLTVQYAVGMLRLADTVLTNADLATAIREGLGRMQGSRDSSEDRAKSQTAELAALYKSTLSTLPRPIQVQGSAAVLSGADNAAAIRSLLLVGCRSALFWRQLGGKRWQLLFGRRRIARGAAELRKALASQLH